MTLVQGMLALVNVTLSPIQQFYKCEPKGELVNIAYADIVNKTDIRYGINLECHASVVPEHAYMLWTTADKITVIQNSK